MFTSWKDELGTIVDRELPRLEAALDAAGVPWTPGRGSGLLDDQR
jgi:hypothetical protein